MACYMLDFATYRPPDEWRVNREAAWANGPYWSVSVAGGRRSEAGAGSRDWAAPLSPPRGTPGAACRGALSAPSRQ